MNWQSRDRYWLAACCLLAVGLGLQSWRVQDMAARLEAVEARPYWPDRPEPLGLEQDRAPRFTPTTRKTIPDGFWGEFAEDVHNCGSEQTLLIKSNQLIWSGDERQTIEKVEWKTAQRLEVDVRDESGMRASFGMALSDDREEITFVYTNTKNVVQRCSARAHESPDALRSADEASIDNGGVMTAQGDLSTDANMMLDPELTMTSR